MNRRETQTLLNQYGLKPTRSLGQNFLVDERAVATLLDAAALSADDQVIEIGPGAGSITRRLAEQAGRVIAVEIDEKLRPILETISGEHDNLQLVWADARQTSLTSLAQHWPGTTVVYANLPYYITTELVEQLICQLPQSRQLLLMMQKETADRFLSPPGTRQYGPTSILIALHGSASRLITLSPAAFWPQPNVDSIVLQLQKKDEATPWSEQADKRSQFLRFLNNCIQQRRKQLKNNLAYLGQEALAALFEAADLQPTVRAEQVTPEQYVQLFERLLTRST